MILDSTPGTPVFRYDVPYLAFEEYAFVNRDIYGEDPDWEQVRADYMGMVGDSLDHLSTELDDINRRSMFHKVNLTESPNSYGFIIWISDRDAGRVADIPNQAVRERGHIIDRLRRTSGGYGFHEEYHTDPNPKGRAHVSMNVRGCL